MLLNNLADLEVFLQEHHLMVLSVILWDLWATLLDLWVTLPVLWDPPDLWVNLLVLWATLPVLCLT